MSSEAIAAQIDAAPKILAINKEQMPQYAQLYTDILSQQAPQRADINLKQQQVYGPQLIDAALANVKRADPTGFQIRGELGSQTLSDLQLGGKMSPQQLELAQQNIRNAQVARGAGGGMGDAQQEALSLQYNQDALKQQREANASAFLAGRQPVPMASTLSPSGAPISPDVNRFATQSPSTNQLMSLGMQSAELGTQQANFASNYNMRGYEYVDQNTSNPFLQGLAGFGGFAASIVGSVMGGGGSGSQFGSSLMGAASSGGGSASSSQYQDAKAGMGVDFNTGSTGF